METAIHQEELGLRMRKCFFIFVALSICFLATTASSAVIAQWQFNEKSPGATASSANGAILDSSGNAHHLTASGNPLPVYTTGATSFGGTSAWQLGGTISPKMNECQVVELADGRLLMNLRNADSSEETRAVSYSSDGGITWSAVDTMGCLYEAGASNSYETITFARFSLAWLSDGADRPARRRVKLERTGSGVSLSWPAAFSNGVVEFCEQFGGSSKWFELGTPPELIGGFWTYLSPTQSPQRFYRLKIPEAVSDH